MDHSPNLKTNVHIGHVCVINAETQELVVDTSETANKSRDLPLISMDWVMFTR